MEFKALKNFSGGSYRETKGQHFGNGVGANPSDTVKIITSDCENVKDGALSIQEGEVLSAYEIKMRGFYVENLEGNFEVSGTTHRFKDLSNIEHVKELNPYDELKSPCGETGSHRTGGRFWKREPLTIIK